jgi:hypothetical protein
MLNRLILCMAGFKLGRIAISVYCMVRHPSNFKFHMASIKRELNAKDNRQSK